MSPPLFRKSALAAALVSLGLAVGVSAQSPSQQPAGGTAATPSPPAAGSTGMDKGAGSVASKGTSAPTSSSAKASTPSTLSSGERRFLEKAAQGSMAEIELGKLAMERASSPQAKDLAKKIVDDHTKALAETKRIASAKGVTLPTELDGKHKRLRDKLAKKSGNDFDREYTDEMEDDHGKDVREFRSMAKNAKDPDVKAFAASTLPVLEQHHAMAKAAEDAAKQARKGDGATSTARTSGSSATSSSGASGAGPSGTAKSTATPGKDTAATTGTAGPGTGMPASSTQSTGSAPQPPGSASDTKTTSPPK